MIQPLHDKVLLQKEEQKETTAGGLYVPKTVEGVFVTAKVVAVGPGAYATNGTLMPTSVKVDDRVLCHKDLMAQIKDEDGTSYYLVGELDILCKFAKE